MELSEKLFLFDHWRIFINSYLKNFLVRPTGHNYVIKFIGPTVSGRQMSSLNPVINLPIYRGRTCHINHLLHPNFFLYSVGELIRQNKTKHDLLVLHAAGVVVNNKAVLITGRPGSGKSTTLHKLVPPLVPLSDDQIIIASKKGGLVAYPSPFSSKIDLSKTSNTGYPVVGVVIPAKNRRLALTKVPVSEALSVLLNETLLPLTTKKIVKKVLSTISPLSHRTFILSHKLHDNIFDIINTQFNR